MFLKKPMTAPSINLTQPNKTGYLCIQSYQHITSTITPRASFDLFDAVSHKGHRSKALICQQKILIWMGRTSRTMSYLYIPSTINALSINEWCYVCNGDQQITAVWPFILHDFAKIRSVRCTDVTLGKKNGSLTTNSSLKVRLEETSILLISNPKCWKLLMISLLTETPFDQIPDCS